VALEVIAEVCGNESNSSSDADRRQLAALEERVHLPAGDRQEGGRSIDREQRFQRPLDSPIYSGMSAHGRTVPHAAPAKSTHNERVLFHGEDEQATLATRLARDDVFREKVRAVSGEPASARRTAAHREASSYAPNRGAHRDYIVRLLLLGATGQWRTTKEESRAAELSTSFANDCRTAHWLEADLGPLDGRRIRSRSTTLEEAAEFVARFGAFCCIRCGTSFKPISRYEYAALSNRRSRRYHCDACKDTLGRSLAESQKEAIKKVFDVATGQHRLYRAARRAL